MKVWIPFLQTGSGTDVFTALLRSALEASGCEVFVRAFPKRWQYFPLRLMTAKPPPGTDLVVANSWTAFAFRRPATRLVAVEHHCVLDPAYTPYRNPLQAIFHEFVIRSFESESLRRADAAVAVSAYTARSVADALGVPHPHVILNGIDTDFFTPGDRIRQDDTRPFRLLYVGNHSRRKGADLLPEVMRRLGDGFELSITSGLRDACCSQASGIVELGRLSREDLRHAYRAADLLLFPSRFEGFGYAPAEAMSCGTPVVCSDVAALPEVVEHGRTGLLCPVDDVAAFAGSIRSLANEHGRLVEMGLNARALAVERFSLHRGGLAYLRLFERLLPTAHRQTK